MKKILYISYDGMTDPLGQSQVIPYLLGLSKEGYQFTILSFEKKERYRELQPVIESILEPAGIKWEPLWFTTSPPLLSKFYDAVKMRSKALALHRRHKFDMIHCRSYLASNIGLLLKKKTGVNFFFDMRGFWADEKKDGGAWRQDHLIFRKVYKYFKKKEAEYLQNADYIISLTQAGKNELVKWPSFNPAVPISVIPCCADMRHFSLTSSAQKMESRKLLNLPVNALVLSYLGSVGSWYMLDEMLDFFSTLKEKYPEAVFLFITHSSPSLILDRLRQYGIATSDICIVKAGRDQVPVFTKASDLSISFIRPVYSKLSSSPTKMGEILSMGIPMITNAGVGDTEEIMNSTGGGYVVHHFNKEEYRKAVLSVEEILTRPPHDIRQKASAIYSLNKGISDYKHCYEYVFNDHKPVSQ